MFIVTLIKLSVVFTASQAFALPVDENEINKFIRSEHCKPILMRSKNPIELTASLLRIEQKLKRVRSAEFRKFATLYIDSLRATMTVPTRHLPQDPAYRGFFRDMAKQLKGDLAKYPEPNLLNGIELSPSEVTSFVQRTVLKLQAHALAQGIPDYFAFHRLVLDYQFSLSLLNAADWQEQGIVNYSFFDRLGSHSAIESQERILAHAPWLLILPSFEFSSQATSTDGIAVSYVFPVIVTGIRKFPVGYDGRFPDSPLRYYQHDLEGHGRGLIANLWGFSFFNQRGVIDGKRLPIEFVGTELGLLMESERRLDFYLAYEDVKWTFTNHGEILKAELLDFMNYIAFHENTIEGYRFDKFSDFWNNWEKDYPGVPAGFANSLTYRLSQERDLGTAFPLVRKLFWNRADLNTAIGDVLKALREAT